MEEQPRRRCAGIDWAKDYHALCVVDEEGRVLWEGRFAHDERGLSGLCAKLVQTGVCRTAIERPEGVLLERLLDAGLAVIPVHPNQLKASRSRFRASGQRAKSDPFDAFCLAELARTDSHRFRALVPDSDQTKALRAMTRAREDLVGTRVALANQLRAELEAFWAGAAVIFKEIDSAISLAFIERYPSPKDGRGLGEKRLADFLSRQGYSGRKSASELLRRLREAPAGRAGQAELRARRATVLGLVATLKALVEQISLSEERIAQAVRAHPDGEVFLSLFRSPKSTLTAACLLAEIGDRRGRYPTNDAMAADAGMSPVAIQSGRRKVAGFRRACDKRLRKAVATLAESTRHHNPWAEDVYRRARVRPRARDPDPRARLGKGHLQDVAGRDALRAGQARQPKTPPVGGGVDTGRLTRREAPC